MAPTRRQRAKKPTSDKSSMGESPALGKRTDVPTDTNAAPSSRSSVIYPPVAGARCDEQASVGTDAASPNETARSGPARTTSRLDTLAIPLHQDRKRRRDTEDGDARSNRLKREVTAEESSDSGYVTEGSPHAKDIDEFLSKLKERVVGMFPLAPTKYAATHIVFIKWKHVDLMIDDEIKELEEVFKKMHFTTDPAKFTTEQFLIPSEYSEYELQAKFTELKRKTLMRDSLLIIYYGGHCKFKERKSLLYAFEKEPQDWQRYGEPPPELDWTKVSGVFADEVCTSDMLFIMDCCCAASISNEALWPGGKKWLFAASGLTSPASAGNHPTDASFTRALIQELKNLKGTNFNLYLLNSYLLVNQASRGLKNTPYLIAISKEATQSATGILFHYPEGQPDDEVLKNSKIKAKEGLQSGFRVLISIRLDKPPKYVEDFVQWLRSAPPAELLGIDDISRDILRVEAAFEHGSTLMLVSIPVAIWVSLPPDGSCSFIDMIRSPNFIQNVSKPAEEAEQILPAKVNNSSLLYAKHGKPETASTGPEAVVRTVLHEAASEGHEAMVRMLLRCGADVNAKDKSGLTALHKAASGGHEAVIRLLVKYGADVDTEDKSD